MYTSWWNPTIAVGHPAIGFITLANNKSMMHALFIHKGISQAEAISKGKNQTKQLAN